MWDDAISHHLLIYFKDEHRPTSCQKLTLYIVLFNSNNSVKKIIYMLINSVRINIDYR